MTEAFCRNVFDNYIIQCINMHFNINRNKKRKQGLFVGYQKPRKHGCKSRDQDLWQPLAGKVINNLKIMDFCD